MAILRIFQLNEQHFKYAWNTRWMKSWIWEIIKSSFGLTYKDCSIISRIFYIQEARIKTLMIQKWPQRTDYKITKAKKNLCRLCRFYMKGNISFIDLHHVTLMIPKVFNNKWKISNDFKMLRLIVVKLDGFIRTKVIKCADSKMHK